jgi:dipeptidyl aminopeptidase/acylaminoacyl peptidase
LLPPNALNTALAISGKGNRLAYTRSIADQNIGRASITDPQKPPAPFIYSTRLDLTPQYSPDGAKIAFESDRSGRTEVWVCNADSSNQIQITVNGGHRARWSPDSRQIVFQDDNGIVTIDARGGPQHRVEGTVGSDRTPSWSHDGRWIYFSSNRSGTSQVWKAPFAGGAAAQVTRTGGGIPFESMDGGWVFYIKETNSGRLSLWKTPVAGGEETMAVEPGRYAIARSGIYFLPVGTADLRHYSFANGITRTIRPLQLQLSGGPWFTVSPDEQWLLYTQVDQGGSDLMLVENFQ